MKNKSWYQKKASDKDKRGFLPWTMDYKETNT